VPSDSEYELDKPRGLGGSVVEVHCASVNGRFA